MMKFTDMNFDCLETVLEYLELIDLLNVADSTKRLNKAAELVFARKHGKKTVRIDAIPISRNRAFFNTDNTIVIEDSKIALQLLRCFGPVISKLFFLETDDENLHEMSVKIVTYINKYCADYLEELLIYRHSSERSDLFNYIDRPFPKLIKFYNMGLEFVENSSLNRLFPNMRCLKNRFMFNSSFFDINTKHFPYLEELSIFESGESSIRIEMVIKLLQLNPHLKDLAIMSMGENSILNTDLIRTAVDSLQNVERLSLHLKPITFLDDSDNIIRMKSVKSFEIRYDMHNHSYNSSPILPFSFEKLEKFYIWFPPTQYVNGSFIDQFFNFIDRHPSITNLKIWDIGRFNVMDWLRLATSLPLLLEIEMVWCYISADEAIEIMAKFQMLKKFRFELRDDYDNFRKRLGKNWEGTFKSDSEGVELHRKT